MNWGIPQTGLSLILTALLLWVVRTNNESQVDFSAQINRLARQNTAIAACNNLAIADQSVLVTENKVVVDLLANISQRQQNLTVLQLQDRLSKCTQVISEQEQIINQLRQQLLLDKILMEDCKAPHSST